MVLRFQIDNFSTLQEIRLRPPMRNARIHQSLNIAFMFFYFSDVDDDRFVDIFPRRGRSRSLR